MQDAPGKTGSPLGHVDFVTIELAGLLHGRIQAEVSIKLLWGRKQVKGAHFSDQDDCAEKTDTTQGLEKEDAVINRCPFQLINSLMQFLKYPVQMLLVFPVGFDIQLDPECIALKRASENSGILCGSTYGIIFGNGIFFTETCGFAYGFHKFVFWSGKHVSGKGVSFQKL